MNNALVFSNDVLRMLQGLPLDERHEIVTAIVNDMLTGDDSRGTLSQVGNIVYAMITTSIRRDSLRYQRSLA